MTPPTPSRAGAVVYWTVAVALTVFGFIDLIAIGAPFFLTGLAMLVAGPWRHRPGVLWPAVAVWAFALGYVLLGPLGCTTSGTAPALPGSPSPVDLGRTVCTNVLGLDYSGSAPYEPSLVTGLLAGLVLGLTSAFVARRLLAGRGRHPGSRAT